MNIISKLFTIGCVLFSGVSAVKAQAMVFVHSFDVIVHTRVDAIEKYQIINGIRCGVYRPNDLELGKNQDNIERGYEAEGNDLMVHCNGPKGSVELKNVKRVWYGGISSLNLSSFWPFSGGTTYDVKEIDFQLSIKEIVPILALHPAFESITDLSTDVHLGLWDRLWGPSENDYVYEATSESYLGEVKPFGRASIVLTRTIHFPGGDF